MPRKQVLRYICVTALVFVMGIAEGYYLDEIVSFLRWLF